VVATDHAVFNTTQKRMGLKDFRIIPNGVNGLEERIPVVWKELVETGKLTPRDFVRVTSADQARIFGVYPQKGAILEGSDADLFILNPDKRTKISAKTHHSRMDINVFEGWETPMVETTISRGKVAWDGKKLLTSDGDGKFIPTPPFPPHLFEGLEKVTKVQGQHWERFPVERPEGIPEL
jgi:dihydropyrimidinase